MIKKTLLIILATLHLTSLAVSETLFHQQIGDGCRIMPVLNCYKLTELTKNIIDKAPWYEWMTIREHLGENFTPYYTWMNSVEILNRSPNKYPNLYKYLTNAIIEGPAPPHIFMTKTGKFR